MSGILQASVAVAALAETLEGLGFGFEEGDDFAAFKAIYEPLGRGPVNPAFDVARQPVTGFWLVLRDKSGGVAAIQAVRYLGDCGPDLHLHLLARRDDYLPLGSPIDPEKSEIVSVAAHAIGGAGCYHGEFYVVPGQRGRGLAGLLIRLAQLMAWLRWQPDFFFGLTIPATSSQRFADRMGYGAFEPRGVLWRDGDGRLLREEGLVWSSAMQLRRLARQPFAGISQRIAFAVTEVGRPRRLHRRATEQ
ncbi:MAG: hypothetical protein ACFCUQ_12875 [Kiloniellales bacterium]